MYIHHNAINGIITMNTKHLTIKDAIAGAENGSVIVVDLRDAGEIAASGAAKGALRIPLSLLPMQGNPTHPDFNKALASGKPIALYCAAGGRAGRGCDILREMGFDDVHNIGGLIHWQSAGGPVVR